MPEHDDEAIERLSKDDITRDEPEETLIEGDDDGYDINQEDKSPELVVLIFHGVEDGELEDVVQVVQEEGEKRGLFPVYAGIGGSLTLKDVGKDTPFHEALTGERSRD